MDFRQPWDLADVIFVVEGKKIYANKGVLTMSSDVFKVMFASEFKEKKMTEIPLPDKRFGDLLLLMQLVHPLPNVCVEDTNVERLLPLAHEYQIHQVVERCKKVLLAQPPSIHNLTLADKFSLTELRKVFFDYLKHIPYSNLQDHPEFDMVDADTRVEVLEHQSMFQEPSIANLFLAEKYGKPDVYDRCLKYLKDTELVKLSDEDGFDKLKPSILIEVLTHKVRYLEPRLRLLEPHFEHIKINLANLKSEVSYLTNWGHFDEQKMCSGSGKRLSPKHLKGTNHECYRCLQARVRRIDMAIFDY